MLTEDEAVKKVRTYFDTGYNCAESILMIMQEYLGVDVDPKMATGFGGGIARKRAICGAITGSILVIDIKYGRNSEKDGREPAYERTQKLWDMMEKKYGTVVCRELIDLPQNQTRGTQPKGHHQICNRVVEDAIRYMIIVLKE